MRPIYTLVLLPVMMVLVGPFFLNRVTPYLFGIPFLLAWLSGALVITSAVMGVIFYSDRARLGAHRVGHEGV